MTNLTKRQIEIIVLCEDKQQWVFIRQYLVSSGFRNNKITPLWTLSGSGEKFVRNQYAKEVKTLRSKNYRSSLRLVVMIDADVETTEKHLQELATELEKAGLNERQSDEKIAVFIPKRNIETWIHYLMGTEVDETTAYAKFNHESNCKPYIENLAQNICPVGLPLNAPPSLHHACDELKRIL